MCTYVCSLSSHHTLRNAEGRIRSISLSIFDADAPSQLFGYMLHLPVFPGKSMLKTGARILYPDHQTVTRSYGLYVNTFIPGTLDRSIDQVPEYIRQHVLIGCDAEVAGDLVQDKTMTAYRQWQQALH